MNVIISGGTPNSIGAAITRTSAAHPAGLAPTTEPAATVEISSAAREAYAAGQGRGAEDGSHPLNIIWGNGPR